jgi:uncharacterized protein YdhG (YjbR/CyaY superfamily)
MKTSQISDIDNYIATFPPESQVLLEQLRTTIKNAAPNAEEIISYGMPAFKLNKRILVYFASHKNHIGFYPGASGIEAFKNEISAYKWAKGTVQFTLDQPLPLELITNMVKFKIIENTHRLSSKKK